MKSERPAVAGRLTWRIIFENDQPPATAGRSDCFYGEIMNPKRFITTLLILFSLTAVTLAQENSKPKADPPVPRAKDGKKLLTAMDLLRINGVANPRISPDGSRVAYTVSEVKMEKDKE